MTTTTTEASVRLTVSLPDAGAGRFYFSRDTCTLILVVALLFLGYLL